MVEKDKGKDDKNRDGVVKLAMLSDSLIRGTGGPRALGRNFRRKLKEKTKAYKIL